MTDFLRGRRRSCGISPDRPVRDAGLWRHDAGRCERVSRSRRSLDVVADNPYHGTQDHMDGRRRPSRATSARSLKHANFLVTETNAQTHRMGFGDPVSAVRWPDAARCVYRFLERREYGRVLALGIRFIRAKRLIGRACSATTLSRTAPMPRSRRTAHELQQVGPHLVEHEITTRSRSCTAWILRMGWLYAFRAAGSRGRTPAKAASL